jgi:hypothetical protein
MAVNENLITGITANLPGGVCDTKYITLTTSGGTQLTADCSSWFSGYASEIRKSTDEYGGRYLQLYNCNTMVGLSVNLQDWFMEKADSSAFTAHTADTNIHVTYSEKSNWNTAYNSLGSFVTGGRYDSHYRPEGYTTDIPAILLTNNTGASEQVLAYIDATDFIKDGMVDNVSVVTGTASGDVLRITFNTDAGKSDIDIPLSSIFDPTNYYDKQSVNGLLMEKASSGDVITGINYSTYDGYLYLNKADGNYFSTNLRDYFASTGDTITGMSYSTSDGYLYLYRADSMNSISTNLGSYFADYSSFTGHTGDTSIHVTSNEKADWNSAYTGLSSHAGDTSIHVTSGEKTNWDAAYTGLTAHTGDSSIHFTASDLQSSGFVTTQYTAYTAVTDTIADGDMSPITSNAVYDWTDGVKIKKITQSAYDALVQAGTVDPNTLYIITD